MESVDKSGIGRSIHSFTLGELAVMKFSTFLDLSGNGNRKYNKYHKFHLTTSYSWNKITFQIEKNSKLS